MAPKFHTGGVVPPNEPVRLFDLPSEYPIPQETYERLQRYSAKLALNAELPTEAPLNFTFFYDPAVSEKVSSFAQDLILRIAETVGVSEDMLRDDSSRSSYSLAVAHKQALDRIHGRGKRMPVILWPWRTREPRSGDMQQMLADIDQVELTPASRHRQREEWYFQRIKDDVDRDRARSKVMLNQMYGTFAP